MTHDFSDSEIILRRLMSMNELALEMSDSTVAALLKTYPDSQRRSVLFDPLLRLSLDDPATSFYTVGERGSEWRDTPAWAPLSKLAAPILQGFSHDAVELCEPTDEQLRLLSEAKAKLRGWLGEPAESVFRHVAAFVFVDRVVPSDAPWLSHGASAPSLPGLVFLAPAPFDDPRELAADVFHEAVHHKHYDLARTLPLLETTEASIVAHWNESTEANSNRWNLRRALSACCVYHHLTLLARAMGDPLPDSIKHAEERASYLAEKLTELQEESLTEAGRQYLHWLTEM
ncbi:hypothetical protein JYT22_00020 [Endomicrobium sp. AH-315-J14]|nr:hypothetical protein [Endomicrobium sp. AH-315-J14]